MRIGIDLDDTILRNNVIEIASKAYGLDFSKRDVYDWEFSNFPKNVKDLIYLLYKEPSYMVDNAEFINGSIKKLKEWSMLGFEVYIVTNRPMEIRKATIEKFKNLLPITDIYFSNGSKKEILKELNLDVWIDDAPHGILEAIELGIEKVYMVSNLETKYNWHILENPKINLVVDNINDIDNEELYIC